MTRSPALLLVVLAPWLAPGCAHTEKTVSYKFVRPATLTAEPTTDSKIEVKRGETVFVDAKPIEPLASPSYPIAAPPRANESVTIVVRLVVGADGRVEEVRRSIGDLTAPTPFSRACFDAVEAAVTQWRFEPAQLAVVAPQPNGRPRIVSSTPTERPFEVAFTFSSSGRVASEFSKNEAKPTTDEKH